MGVDINVPPMNNRNDATVHCCAECGVAGGISLKACMSCKLVRYCNVNCQRNHWKKHKKECKQRAAELHDEALLKDPPAKEDCPICFILIPIGLVCCVSLPPATISSVPIRDFANANEELANKAMEQYYSCCGKSICSGCIHSFCESGNLDNCPYCNAEVDKTDEEYVEDIMKRVAANDAGAMYILGSTYEYGGKGLQHDHAKAMELYARATDLGSSKARYNLAVIYRKEGDLKKAKFHTEAAAMAGHEEARNMLGNIEFESGNKEQAVKHWIIAASAGNFVAMHHLKRCYENGYVSRESIDSTLTAYNTSCVEMRSEARDAYIDTIIHRNM